MKNNIHIGKLIEEEVRKKKLSITNFAKLINCERTNVYHIFASHTLDYQRLQTISDVLQHDFMQYGFDYSSLQLTINLNINNINSKKQYIEIVEKIKNILPYSDI